MRALVVMVSILWTVAAGTASVRSDAPAPPDDVARRLATRAADAENQVAQAGEREGQDPDAEVDVLPGNSAPGERVGSDPDVPGGNAATTPVSGKPGERIGNDPDVPGGSEPVK